MGEMINKLEEYVERNLEPKLISYVPDGNGFSLEMRDAFHKKTSKEIAQELFDIFMSFA